MKAVQINNACFWDCKGRYACLSVELPIQMIKIFEGWWALGDTVDFLKFLFILFYFCGVLSSLFGVEHGLASWLGLWIHNKTCFLFTMEHLWRVTQNLTQGRKETNIIWILARQCHGFLYDIVMLEANRSAENIYQLIRRAAEKPIYIHIGTYCKSKTLVHL